MRKVVLLSSVILLGILGVIGCSKMSDNMSEQNSDEIFEVFGTTDFLSNIYGIVPPMTKSSDITEAEVREIITPILNESVSFLDANGYDCLEDFESYDDPRIVWVALALSEIDLYSQAESNSLGSCVLEAVGLRDILTGGWKKIGTKKLIIKIAGKTAAKYVPYIGGALIAIDFIHCMAENHEIDQTTATENIMITE